ncbi:MAG: substrate-binding domain-containing protein [Armatimonadota bacterium]
MNTTNRRRFLNCLLLGAAVAVAGCSGGEKKAPTTAPVKTEPGASAVPAGKVWNIGFSQCNLGEPWRVQMNADIKAAANKHADKVKVIFQDAQNDTPTQQSQIRQFIQQGINLIIMSPKEDGPFVGVIGEAVKKDIPVIVLDRDQKSANYTCFIGGNNKQIGVEAGRYVAKLLGGKGTVIELRGLMTSTPAQDRHNGFLEGIKGSNIKIIFDADCKWLEPNARAEMTSAMSRFDKIDAVYGHNDPSAHGAWTAAKQEGKGREKTIKFIGIDGLPKEGQRYVKDGILAATFTYPTCGPEAIETAIMILSGEKVEKRIILPTKAITP